MIFKKIEYKMHKLYIPVYTSLIFINGRYKCLKYVSYKIKRLFKRILQFYM